MTEKAVLLHTVDTVFDYLDWCKEHGYTLEQTHEMGVARRYGAELHSDGIEVSYFDLLLMTGQHRKAYYQ